MSSKTNEDKPVQSTYKTPGGLAGLFSQVDDVKATMAQNIEAINERGTKLEELENSSREMLGQSENFAKQVGKKKKK